VDNNIITSGSRG